MAAITSDHFYLIGISHKTAPIEAREKVSCTCTGSACGISARRITEVEGVSECVLLSTCNRTEMYLLLEDGAEHVRARIEELILAETGESTDFLDYFYYMQGEDVIGHLFGVTSGIDSMILGEPQIFGQVKEAYADACDQETTGPAMNRLFHHAFQVGKRTRYVTSIGEGVISVGSAAVVLARDMLGTLTGKTVLLVGAGKVGELCAKQLGEAGIDRLIITNRTYERARDLAVELGGDVVPFDEMEPLFDSVDIIITSVTSQKPLFTKDLLKPHLSSRDENAPLAIIDLGVPRNVAKDVAGLSGIHIMNIDDLEGVTLDNHEKRKNEVGRAEEIIAGEVETFNNWIEEREVIPVIQDLRRNFETIRLDELQKLRTRIDDDTYDVLNTVTRRIVRKILHNPTISVRSSESGEVRRRLMDAINELFIRESDS